MQTTSASSQPSVSGISTNTKTSGDANPFYNRSISMRSCDFEAAITASGFGKFNVYVILIAVFTGLICVFEVRLMAYVVPAAQCDLHLGIHEKAILNSIPLAGMVITSFISGFVGDALGRRKLIVFMCFTDCLCMVMAALSQSFQLLLAARLLGGMVSSGIYPSLASYLTEVHVAKHRAVMQLLLGSIYGLGDFLLPMIAVIVLTNPQDIEIKHLMVVHPWNKYLLICSLPPLLGGIGFLCLPESPKFLMSKKYNEKAINAFQSIYTLNTNNTKEDYPVKSLKQEAKIENDDVETTEKSFISECLDQLSPFFERQHFINLILSISAQFLILMGLNSILLWLPQILQEMNNYQRSHNNTATICQTLNDLHVKTNEENDFCEEDMSRNTKIYMFCMIVASTTIIVFVISGVIVNTIGKKKLLYILGICSAIATLLLINAQDFLITLGLASVICSFGNIGFNTLVAIVVDLFPTNLRAMSVSLTMMMGRLGGALGCFIFPVFLSYGCEPPLLFIAYFTFVWIFLVYLLPHSEKTAIG